MRWGLGGGHGHEAFDGVPEGLQLLGGYSYQSTIDSSSASYDHARRTLTVYAVLTLTLIL